MEFEVQTPKDVRKQSDQLVGQHSPAAQLGSGDYKLVPTVLRENDLNSKVTFAKAQYWSMNLRYLYFTLFSIYASLYYVWQL